MSTAIALRQRPVLDSSMAYREVGSPDAPVALFLHGNPTSSYIWRNILPRVATVAHCIAPDLIGFGASGKPDIEYRFRDQVRYLDAFVDSMGIRSAYLVAQDWGTALAFHLAARRPGWVRGLAFMEFIRPLAGWDEFHQLPAARELFSKFRTPGLGQTLIMEQSVFLERVLPGSVARKLSEEEMADYRAPFPTVQSRLPIWRLPNEVPIGGAPADVHADLTAAHAALKTADYPKLLFTGKPGALVSPAYAAEFAAGLKHCRLVPLESGMHYLQEDEPATIGESVAGWIEEIEEARQPRRLQA